MSVAREYEELRALYRNRMQSRIREQTLRSYDGQTIDAKIGQYHIYGLPDGLKLVLHSYDLESIRIIDEALENDDACTRLLERADKLARHASTGVMREEVQADRVLGALADLRVVAVQPPGQSDWYRKPYYRGGAPICYVRLRALLVEDQADCYDIHMNEGILPYLGKSEAPDGRAVYQYSSPIGGFEIIQDGEDGFRVRAYPTFSKLAERYAITDGTDSSNGIQRILSNGVDLPTADGHTHFQCFEEAAAFVNARFRGNTLNNWHVNDPYSVLDIKDGLQDKVRETQALVRHKGKHWLHEPDKVKSTGACILWLCERACRSMGDVAAGFFRFLNTLWGPAYDSARDMARLRRRPRHETTVLDAAMAEQFNMQWVTKVLHDPLAWKFFNNLDARNPETFTVDTDAALTMTQKAVQQAKSTITDFGSAAGFRGRDILNPLALLSKAYLLDPVDLGILDSESDYRETTRCNQESIDRLRILENLTDPLNPFLGGTCYMYPDGVITLQHGGLVRDFIPDGVTVHVRYNSAWHDHERMPAMEPERRLLDEHSGEVLVVKDLGLEPGTGLPVFEKEPRSYRDSRREIARVTGNDAWRLSAVKDDSHANLAETGGDTAQDGRN